MSLTIQDGLQVARQQAASHHHVMLTFGFSTLIDFLSWIAALAIGLKVAATLIVLIVNKDMRDQPGWGSALWWVTKITPIVAGSCLICIALRQRDTGLVWFYCAAGLFVVVAVPLKIRQRRNRIAARMPDERPARP
ncbi:hypothetical protein [Pseudomonas sp. JAI120]|uniref:hypothetical protein n=1 Tax=Pseudomonas sp. JAI120 TaxID=2723063 RepID=UPI0030DC24E3